MSRRAASLVALASAFVLSFHLNASGQARNWPSESPPRPLAASEVRFPPYELETLDNGLRVVVVMHHEQPVVSLRLLVRAGSADDPPGRQGTATLVAALLDQGTANLDARQIADTIDSAGGLIECAAGRDLSFLHVVVLSDTLDMGMALLADMARNPSFSSDEIERQRQQLLAGLRVSEQDPEYMANVAFDRLVFGFHPYGFPIHGTAETLARVTRSDIEEYHRTHYAPNNAILAVVGDVTAEQAFSAVEKAFGDWEPRKTAERTAPEPPAPTARIVILDKPDAVQTEIRAGHLGVPRNSRDYLALDMAVKILGGEGANRLHRVLRVERGLTYGAEARLEAFAESGAIKAITNTRSETTGETLRLLVDEFYRMRREGASQRELAAAKAYLTGKFPLTIETPQAIATQVLDVLFYGLPVEELETYRDRVDAVQQDQVAGVVSSYLRPDRLSIVLVGNASAFKDQLKGVGFGRFEVIPLAELDLSRADLRRPAAETTPGTNGGREAQDAGELLQRAIAAKGGLERLQGIRTVVARSTTIVEGSAGPLSAPTTTRIEYPSRFRVELELASGTVIQTWADGDAWIQDAAGVHDVPPNVRETLEAGAERDVLLLLVRAARGEVKARRVSPTPAGKESEKSDMVALEFELESGRTVTLDIDPATGLVSRQRYTEAGRLVEETYSDYRDVDGVQVAFTAARRSGSDVTRRSLESIVFNERIEAGLFSRPSR